MSNDVYCFTASTISVYIDGSPFTMEISCCTNMLPNSVSKAMTITARPIRLTADARPRFQPCRTIETTSGSTASAMNIEMTTSSTMVDILPHDARVQQRAPPPIRRSTRIPFGGEHRRQIQFLIIRFTHETLL